MLKRFWSLARQYFESWAKVGRFARRFRLLWRKAFLANLFGGISSGLQLLVPVATIVIINDAIPNQNLHLLVKYTVLMGLATLGSVVASYFEFYFASVFRERASLMLTLELFEHVQAQPFLFFKSNESGYVMSRITSDASAAIEIVASLTAIGKTLVWLLGGIVLLPYMHLKIGLIILASIPLYFATILWLNKRTKDAFSIVQEKTATTSRELYESLTGIYETKAFGAQQYRARRYMKANIERARILIKARMLMMAGGQTTQVLTLLLSLFIITFGGAAVISGQLSLGALIGMNAFAAYLLVPVNRMIQESLKAQQAIASIERIEDLRSLEAEKDLICPASTTRARGHIRYQNVNFAYNNRPPVFEDVSFEILPGEVILLIGPSGVGKSTLVNLLLRYLEPDSGDIYLDGTPIKDLPLGHLRRQTAIVSQDVFLFSDSIANNIRLGNLSASDREISEAARFANASEFIDRLPQQFGTKVGERGSRLSGGQRQRVAIARALIRNAPILILDEATSAVDQETEAAVHEALCHLMEDRTTIIIAHHADAFIERVDRVFRLENGFLEIGPAHSVISISGGDLETRVDG